MYIATMEEEIVDRVSSRVGTELALYPQYTNKTVKIYGNKAAMTLFATSIYVFFVYHRWI